jgi:hypothetical protein
MTAIAQAWGPAPIVNATPVAGADEEISVVDWLRERLLASAGLGPVPTPTAGLGDRLLVRRSHGTEPLRSTRAAA